MEGIGGVVLTLSRSDKNVNPAGKGTLMHPDTATRVDNIRNRVKFEEKRLNEARTILVASTDEYMNGLILQAQAWLDDVEDMFIQTLEKDRVPPRTLAEELAIVHVIEMHLDTVAAPLVKTIRELIDEFGPNIKSMG